MLMSTSSFLFSLYSGLDPSPSASTAPVTTKAPAKRAAAAPPWPSSSAATRLKRLMDDEQDPTCAAATLRHLRQKLQLPTDPRCLSLIRLSLWPHCSTITFSDNLPSSWFTSLHPAGSSEHMILLMICRNRQRSFYFKSRVEYGVVASSQRGPGSFCGRGSAPD